MKKHLAAYAATVVVMLATLRQWLVGIAMLDMAWGTLVIAVSAAAGKAALDRSSMS